MATLKQKRALEIVVENGGNVSRAMLQAGYSPATAKTPQKLTESDGWSELLGKHLPDKKLAALHKRFLDKKEAIVISDGAKEGSHIEWTGQPHSDALKALETVYKLKGRYAEGQGGGNTNIQVNILNYAGNNTPTSIPATRLPASGS